MKSGESRFCKVIRLFGHVHLVLFYILYVIGHIMGDPVLDFRKVMLGHSVVLDCYPSYFTPSADFYIVQWKKRNTPSPVLLWREGQASREGRGYEGRASLLDRASLLIVDLRRTDKGLYECQMWDVNGHPLGNNTSSNLEIIDSIPQFIKQPVSVLTSPGSIAEFLCSTDPPADTIRWLHNGEWWNSSEVSETNNTLRINISVDAAVQEQLVGAYECIAIWEASSLRSKPANLTIAGISPFKDQETVTITAIEGSFAILPGSIPHSVPPALPIVMHNGTLLSPENDRMMMLPSGNMHIQKVQSSDAGWYQVSAKNTITGEQVTAKNSIFLKVTQPEKRNSPQLLAAPKESNPVIMGGNVTLECAANGDPPPVVTWTKYGGILPPGRYKQVLGNLILFDMQPNDTGTYICKAGNGIGFPVSTIATVEVLDFPEIYKWTSEYEVREREEMTLECNTKMHSRSEIRWLFNSTLIENSETIIFKDSKLVIKAAQRNHAGFYQCFAMNGAGIAAATARVRIVPRSAANEEVVVAGGNRKDHSIHLLDRSWEASRNSSTITPGDGSDQGVDEDFKTSKKHKKRKKKGKKYKHGNSDGDNKVVMIPPTRPEVTKLSDESVMVRWDVPPNSGLPISFFKVQYKDITKQNSHWMTIDEDIAPHILSYEVPNLRTGHVYRFRIAAVYSNNDNKLGPNSHKFILQKDPPTKKPIVGPTIVHAEAVSPSAIMIRWQYLDQDEIPIEGFFIYYRATTSAGAYTKVPVLGANTSSHIISHLLPETAYDIKMQCFNSAGTSDFSNIRTEKTLPSAHSSDDKKIDDEAHLLHNLPAVSDTTSSDQLLYTILGCVLGSLTVMLILFVSYCSWKQRQRQRQQNVNSLQSKENGNIHDQGRYTAINGALINGHVGQGNGMLLLEKSRNVQESKFQETSQIESPPVTSNNNNLGQEIPESDSETYSDNDLSDTDHRNTGPATTAACKPLIHCTEENSSSSEDEDDMPTQSTGIEEC